MTSEKAEDKKAASQIDSFSETNRISLLVSEAHKNVITEASVLAGFRDVSEYIIHVSLADAQRVKRESEILTLSKKDSILFMETLLNPPVVNEKLRKAFNEFSENLEG